MPRRDGTKKLCAFAQASKHFVLATWWPHKRNLTESAAPGYATIDSPNMLRVIAMAESAEKKRFLRNMPPKVKFARGRDYRIPAEVLQRIDRFHIKEKSTNCCKDRRDFLSMLALEGLNHVLNGNGNIMEIANSYGERCNKPVTIDYAVLNYDKLSIFSQLVNNSHVKCVQDAVSYCIILGYRDRLAKVVCEEPRVSPPIYS
jgi:hypothetical protein